MQIDKIIKDLETTIKKTAKKIRGSQTISADKLTALSRLTNAYSRLIQQQARCENQEKKFDPMEDGMPGFHESLYG